MADTLKRLSRRELEALELLDAGSGVAEVTAATGLSERELVEARNTRAVRDRANGGVALAPFELGHDLAVPLHAEPGQPLDDRAHGIVVGAGAVGVFDAQAEDAAVMAGVQPVVQGCPGPADMQVTGRGGGETGHDRHGSNSERAATIG